MKEKYSCPVFEKNVVESDRNIVPAECVGCWGDLSFVSSEEIYVPRHGRNTQCKMSVALTELREGMPKQ